MNYTETQNHSLTQEYKRKNNDRDVTSFTEIVQAWQRMPKFCSLWKGMKILCSEVQEFFK